MLRYTVFSPDRRSRFAITPNKFGTVYSILSFISRG